MMLSEVGRIDNAGKILLRVATAVFLVCCIAQTAVAAEMCTAVKDHHSIGKANGWGWAANVYKAKLQAEKNAIAFAKNRFLNLDCKAIKSELSCKTGCVENGMPVCERRHKYTTLKYGVECKLTYGAVFNSPKRPKQVPAGAWYAEASCEDKNKDICECKQECMPENNGDDDTAVVDDSLSYSDDSYESSSESFSSSYGTTDEEELLIDAIVDTVM